MVDVEFNMEANEDTIAAAKAARTNPFNPVGTKVPISHG